MSGHSVTFEDVDDETFETDRRIKRRWLVRPVVILAMYIVLITSAIHGYEKEGESTIAILGREFVLLDWITLLSVCILAIVGIPPLIRHRRKLTQFLRKFARDRVAALGLIGLVVLLVIAVVGPIVYGRPGVEPRVIHNPPVGFSIPGWAPTNCVGYETETTCYGSWAHPLGTDEGGRDILQLVMSGLRTSLQVGVSSAVLAGGIGTIVGLIAGTMGGRTDALLMHYVDLQSAIPAFFVYVFVTTLLFQDLVLMVLVFGLLSWSGLARLVRSEVLRIRDELYIQSAESAGAGQLYTLRYHILPNVTSGVFVPLTNLIPLYILYEAALSFLGLGETDPRITSLGSEVASGLDQAFAYWWDVWWLVVFPATALTVLVLCLLLAGDRLGELLDPRQD